MWKVFLKSLGIYSPIKPYSEGITREYHTSTKEVIPVLTILRDEQIGKTGILPRIGTYVDAAERSGSWILKAVL